MKLKQLITGGALAATVLTLGSAQAEERNPYDGLVFCKVQVTPVNEGDPSAISVTLPYTTTGREGQGYTHWNLGKVPAGGVADSWHGEGGPGKFEAHNDGDVAAYVYLTSDIQYRGDTWMKENSSSVNGITYYGTHVHWFDSNLGQRFQQDFKGAFEDIFGEVNIYVMHPAHSLREWQRDGNAYCLAFTRDMVGKLPTWHMLNRYYTEREMGSSSTRDCCWEDNEEGGSGYIGAYMGYLPAGEYMPFDVKFWAPHKNSGSVGCGFTFRVEAASFPLWEHDIEVK